MENEIREIINKYYTEKINEYGVTPKGVDWNSEESQHLRFKQLIKVIDDDKNFSLLDFGSGYGALYNYLKNYKKDFFYTGVDFSDAMVSQAKLIHKQETNTKWSTSIEESERFDYTIASGIFNVKLEIDTDKWINYIKITLAKINQHSKKGFAFNMLTSYSDKGFMKDYLFYANPAFFFDYCKSHFSKYVSLLHDYQLYEFTIIIKKVL